MHPRPTPAHAVISQQLRHDIAAGDYADGRRLPTEAELAQVHRVSRQTVRRAFHDLVSESLVSRVPGRGTFVNDGARGRYLRSFGSVDDLLTLSRDTEAEVLKPLEPSANGHASSRLRLTTDLVHSLVLRRLHDGAAFVETTVYLPENVAALVASSPELRAGQLGTYTVIGLLEPLLAKPIFSADQSITVALASRSTATALHCRVGHPVLRIDRLYVDADEQPVEYAVSHFLPELYTYRVTLDRSR